MDTDSTPISEVRQTTVLYYGHGPPPIGEALRRPRLIMDTDSNPIGEALRQPCPIIDTGPPQLVKPSDGHALFWTRTAPLGEAFRRPCPIMDTDLSPSRCNPPTAMPDYMDTGHPNR